MITGNSFFGRALRHASVLAGGAIDVRGSEVRTPVLPALPRRASGDDGDRA